MVAMGDADLRVGRLAAGQHSLVTHSQLLGAGLTAPQIDHRVRRRVLLLVHRGVYRMPGVRPTYESHVMAACLATGGLASHGCAARLFGFRGFHRWNPVEVAVEGRRAPRLFGVIGHRTQGLERTRVGVVPVVMPAEALLGVAATASQLAEGAVNDALVRGLASLPGLVRFLNRRAARGRDGVGRLRQLVEEQIRAGGPTENRVDLPGGRVRLDTAWPDLKVNVEADGRLWHTSPSDRRRDAARDARLKAAGWTVVRVTWLQLVEEPQDVADRIAHALGLARPLAAA
jgi:very-short-patch-repair endonuclease